MAGGGSIITVPIMMFLGVPGPVANGTNRVTIVAHNAAAMITYIRHGVPYAKLCTTLTLVAIPPAVIGAYLSTQLNNQQFEWMLAGVMVAVLLLMQFKQHWTNWAKAQNLVAGHLLMAATGFGEVLYKSAWALLFSQSSPSNGAIAGNTNILKVFIIFVYTLADHRCLCYDQRGALADRTHCSRWQHCGGYAGAKLTLSKGDAIIRHFLTAAIIAILLSFKEFTRTAPLGKTLLVSCGFHNH